MISQADVDHRSLQLFGQFVAYPSGDQDAAKIRIRADDDVLNAESSLSDDPEYELAWLAMAPDHGDFRVLVADGLGGLAVFDHDE